MSEALYITSSVGRLVQGDAFAGSDKDHQGKPRTDKTGAPKMQWYIGVAFPKGPEWEAMWAQISGVAQRDFPAGEYNNPGFAWKVVDGDAPEHAAKVGFPGHFILRMSTGYAPTVFDANNQQVVDPSQLQRGYYVQVYFSTRGNGEPANGKPGIYVNHSMVRVVGYGEVISSGPSADQAFGAGPAALPAGASAAPLAPANAMPAAPMAPAAPAPMPAAPMAPAAGVPMAGGYAAPVAPAPMAPAAPPAGPTPPAMAPAPAPMPAPAPTTPAPAMAVPGTPGMPTTAYPSNPPAGVPAAVQPAPNFMAPGQPQ